MHTKGRSSLGTPSQKGTLDSWKFTRRGVLALGHNSKKGHWIIGISQEGIFWPWDTIPKKDPTGTLDNLIWYSLVVIGTQQFWDKPSSEIDFQPEITN